MKKRLLVAVTGGIAAYKAIDVISAFQKNGYWVGAMATPNALEGFVKEYVLKVTADEYYTLDWGSPTHINVTENIDAFVVVPATANTIAKFANGICDNLVTDSFIALPAKTPIYICPAMNIRMWENPRLQKNLDILRENSYTYVIEPAVGKLACGTVGKGKLPPTREIVERILKNIEYIHDYPDYEGVLYNIKSKSFSTLCTPNHRWLVYNKTTKRLEFKDSIIWTKLSR